VTDFTFAERDLLLTAKACGGWLSVSATHGHDRERAMARLIADGLFEFRGREPGVHLARYVLTATGREAVANLPTNH
jgi:hypothetical protein